jgi:hypothetical protein
MKRRTEFLQYGLIKQVLILIIVVCSSCSSGYAKELKYCNFVPYENIVVVISGSGRHVQDINMSEGECKKVNVSSTTQEPLFFYVRARNSLQLSSLRTNDFFRSDWAGYPIWMSSQNGSIKACVKQITAKFISAGDVQTCSKGQELVTLRSLNFNSNGFFFLNIIDPYLCEHVNFNCENASIAQLSLWANKLSQSLAYSLNAKRPPKNVTYGIIPTAIGFNTKDHNGRFVSGIEVTEYMETTLLGSSVPMKTGDIIYEFNNKPIFDRYDFSTYILEHGNSGGYETPYKILFIRKGKTYEAEGYQFFHKIPFRPMFVKKNGTCKNETSAALKASLEEMSFYTQPVLACTKYNSNDEVFYRDKRCEFSVRQLVAAYRQFCPNVSTWASIIGSIFMPGRELAEKSISRYALKSRKLTSKLISSTIVEGMEETTRAIITLPPGIKTSDNLASIREQIMFGASIGLGINLFTRKGLKGGFAK